MGTNYYFFREKMKENEFCDNGLHIGKNSWGWVFNFEGYPDKGITTVQDWRNLTKEGYIYNEYDEEISYEDFWKLVEETKEPMPDGKEKYVLTDPTQDPSPIDLSIPMWKDEGYGFTGWEFC